MSTNETPCLVLLDKSQWQELLSIVSAPTMLDGEGLESRFKLLSTLREAVSVDLYNSCIVNSYEAACAIRDKLNKTSETSSESKPVAEPRPVAANRAENFVPPSKAPKHVW